MSEIRPGIYKHYKGNPYEVVGTAHHSETEEVLVVYRALYGEKGLWVRPLSMFGEIVECGGAFVPRFTRVDFDGAGLDEDPAVSSARGEALTSRVR